jgi:hypothetical protein
MNDETRPRAGPILLGLFIVGQLFFLIAANVLGYLSELRDHVNKRSAPAEVVQAVEHLAPGWLNEQGHLYEVQKLLTSVLKPWEQMTGQYQMWALYSPDIYRDICFPAVEFQWDDPGPAAHLAPLAATNPWEALILEQAARDAPPALDPEVMRSDNEPADANHYFRVGMFRVRRFEGQLEVLLLPEAEPEEWQETIRERVREMGGAMRSYLLWRWHEFEKRHPDRPRPSALVLQMRRYHIRPPQDAPPYWDGPFVVPVARLRLPPGQPPAATLEPYDPVAEEFEEP